MLDIKIGLNVIHEGTVNWTTISRKYKSQWRYKGNSYNEELAKNVISKAILVGTIMTNYTNWDIKGES